MEDFMKNNFYPIDAIRKIPKDVLTVHEKLALILLLGYRNCREVYVSAARVAAEGSMAKSTAENAFRKFVRLGIMRVQKKRHRHSYRFYKEFDMDRLASLANQLEPNRSASHGQQHTCDDIDFDLADIENS